MLLHQPSWMDSQLQLRSVSTASLSGLETTAAMPSKENRDRKHHSSEATVTPQYASSHKEVINYDGNENNNNNNNPLSPSQTLLSTATNTDTTAAAIREGSIEHILEEYTLAYRIYSCPHRLNPGVLTALRYRGPPPKTTMPRTYPWTPGRQRLLDSGKLVPDEFIMGVVSCWVSCILRLDSR